METADTEIHYSMPSESETALVSFGSIGGEPGHFHYFKLLESLPDLTKLLVRDPSDRWYNAGLPGVGDTLEEIAAWLERELARLGAKRVVTFGSSMGGYAAILFGCMLGAERAISLVPQTLLDPVLPHAPPAGVSLQAPDLAPVVRAAPGTRLDLLVGWDDLVDVFHAQRIADLPSVRILALKRGDHHFAERLHRKGELAPLIATLVGGGTPERCHVDPELDPHTEQRIEDAVYAGRRSNWELAAERIGPVAERHRDWSGPHMHRGKALAELRQWEGAEDALTRAVRANPDWPKPREELARALNEQGRPEDAETVVREGIALNPYWWNGGLVLGECLRRMGREEEAHAAALRTERAIRAEISDLSASAIGNLGLAQALLAQGREEEARTTALRAADLDPKLAYVATRILADATKPMAKAEFADWLRQRIEARAPAAVVRYGDGELSSLQARLDDSESIRVAKLKLDGETGLSFSPEGVLEIGRALAFSFDEADVLGILFSHKGVLSENQLVPGRMNPLTERYFERLADGRAPAHLASAQLHHEILDTLPEILTGRRVSVLSSRDVRPVLEADWGLDDVAAYQVPSQFSARDVDDAYESAMHGAPIWPDRHAELLAELTVREPGEVFLIGAGVFGKDLCIHIRELGGLALDLGSALDRIVGKITRGPLRRVRYLHGQGKSLTEIVDDLENRYDAKVDRDKVRRLTEEECPRWVQDPHDLSPLRNDD